MRSGHARPRDSFRDQTVILILALSGLRIGAHLSLKVGDIDFDYPDVAKIDMKIAPM